MRHTVRECVDSMANNYRHGYLYHVIYNTATIPVRTLLQFLRTLVIRQKGLDHQSKKHIVKWVCVCGIRLVSD